MKKLLLKTMVRCSIPMSWLLLMFAASAVGENKKEPRLLGRIEPPFKGGKNQKPGEIAPPPKDDKTQPPKEKPQSKVPDKNTSV